MEMIDARHDSLGRYVGCFGGEDNEIDFSIEAAIFTNLRAVKNFPIPGINFIDVSPLFFRPSVLGEIIEEIILKHQHLNIESVIGLEARGFVLLGAVANGLHAGAVMARKPNKLPLPGKTITYAKEYGEDAISLPEGSIRKGATVLIHDDILATGGTAIAAISLAKEMGAKQIFFNCIVEIVSEGLKGREAILEAHPDTIITSLIKQ